MSRNVLLLTASLIVLGASLVEAAPRRRTSPSPLFINNNPITPPELPPQVDAVTFVNRSLFIYSNDFLFPPFPASPSPYSAQSVRFWTNSGIMLGLPGFRFDYTPNPDHLTSRQRRRPGANLPQPSFVFYNDGEITVSESLEVRARELINRGVLAGDVAARIRLYATNGLADLSRGAVHVGDLPMPDCVSVSNFIFGPFFFFTDPTVNYRYFDSGVSGSVGTNRFPLNLPFLTISTNAVPNFVPPFPAPPFSEYRFSFALAPGLPATNFVTNVLTTLQTCGQYDARVHFRTNVVTNFFAGAVTNRDISVVFVPTNGFSTNVNVRVAFPTNAFPFFGGPRTGPPLVEFSAVYFDVIEQQLSTNFITFRDDGANVFRGRDCQFDLAEPPNAAYSADLFYNPNFETTQVDYSYSVSSVQVGQTNSIYFTNTSSAFFFFPPLGEIPAATDPTNFSGSIEIAARDLDLTQARIRAENAIFIRATNLMGNDQSFIDSPFISLDAGTTNLTLVISNLSRPQVNRLQANFNSWSGAWSVAVTNGFVTNQVITTNGTVTNIVSPVLETWNYQVLILGACVDALHPSIVDRLSLRATNIVIEDNLAINRSIVLEGQSVTFGSNASLTLPRSANLAFTNIQRVTSFTNFGIINVPSGAFFGLFEDGYVAPPEPRPRRRRPRGPEPVRLIPYESFVNHNVVSAANFSARAAYVELSGPRFVPASILASNGPVVIDGGEIVISNATITAQSDIRISGAEIFATQSALVAGSTNGGRFRNQYLPGAIILDATNNLSDGGLGASNQWFTTSGIRVVRRPEPDFSDPEAPLLGDLLGTRAVVRSGTFALSTIVWAGEDRGVAVEGFENNLALGHLVLDGSLGNLFRFRSADLGNAIYVDYLELLNSATNFNFALGVDEDFTIYFGDANVPPEKLDETGGGRIRWVPQFTGPRSSTNITYPNGVTYTFNAGLVRSRDLDSDGDGFVNAEDCTPIPVEGFDTTGAQCPSPEARAKSAALSTQNINLAISLGTGGREVVLNWDAAANSSNTVEYRDALESGAWQPLTNFINGPVNARVAVKDAVGAPLRVYRVRVDAGTP